MNHTDTDLAYVAGLFDGEGSIVIGVSKRKRSDRIVPNHWLQVGIGICEKSLVDWLHSEFGGHITSNGKTKEQGAKRQSWTWRVMSNEGAAFLSSILNYLRIKKEQAELAIEFQTKAAPYQGRPLTQKTIDARERYRNRLRTMTTGRLSTTGW